jgi:sulfate permease, SulP family
MSLVDVRAWQHIRHFSRAEFAAALVAFFGVLGSGPVNGVLFGAAISIVLLLRQAARPRVTELGRIAGTQIFADRSVHVERERTPHVLVARCESALVYFNAEHVRERVFALLGARDDAVRLVVLFLGAVPRIDLGGAELIADLHKTLAARGIEMRLAEAHGEVRDALRRIGFEKRYGPLETGQTVERVLTQWQASAAVASNV